MRGGVLFPSLMHRFSNAREAKEFLISRIVAEAQREKVPLSEIERKMLYFSETAWTLPDIMEVNDEFDREYDQAEYENKIARLIRNETKRLHKENPEEFASWISAARKLKKEDHYISVMIDNAGVPTGLASDNWKGTALVVIAVCVLMVIGLILRHVGLGGVPRGGAKFGSYTIDQRLNNFVGYLWLSFFVLFLCGSAYSHFDRKRRMYKIFDRVLDFFLAGVFKAFGVHEK
jgi:preprotein translocase subunit SecG